jgi:hypothetical protein
VPRLNELHELLRGEDVVFLHVTSESPLEVEAFLEDVPLQGWIASDPDGSALRAMAIRGYPTTLLIDPDGQVAWRGHPEELQAKRIRALLP